MLGPPLIEYQDASAEVRAVYDDIMATRKTDKVNNFWKAIANHPPTLRRTWESVKSIMAAGALDPLTKEMIYASLSAPFSEAPMFDSCGRLLRMEENARGESSLFDRNER